jgi:hypothetical protein
MTPTQTTRRNEMTQPTTQHQSAHDSARCYICTQIERIQVFLASGDLDLVAITADDVVRDHHRPMTIIETDVIHFVLLDVLKELAPVG